MSRPQLYRKIHALTGKSPHELLENARLARAVTLLEDETRNISEVSLELGYTNPSYFSKIFQLRYGCTPSHFK
jgi:AraC-like DNA-binding protein